MAARSLSLCPNKSGYSYRDKSSGKVQRNDSIKFCSHSTSDRSGSSSRRAGKVRSDRDSKSNLGASDGLLRNFFSQFFGLLHPCLGSDCRGSTVQELATRGAIGSRDGLLRRIYDILDLQFRDFKPPESRMGAGSGLWRRQRDRGDGGNSAGQGDGAIEGRIARRVCFGRAWT